MSAQYLPHSATLGRLDSNGGGPTNTLLATVTGPGAQRIPQDGGGGGSANGAAGTLCLTSGSPPLYSCLNDGAPAPGLCRLAGVVPPPPPPPPPPVGQVSIGQANRTPGGAQQQNPDCCSVDTEGSSRQSGKLSLLSWPTDRLRQTCVASCSLLFQSAPSLDDTLWNA